jgi:hypothetical protein
MVKRVTLLKELPLDRIEAIRILRPFFDFILPQPISIPIIRELALLSTAPISTSLGSGSLIGGIHRRCLRLCRLQEELTGLDLKNVKPGDSLEDFVFSKIDFSRYKEIEAKYFETLFWGGLKDFDEAFFREKFYLDKKEVQSMIETSYKKTEGIYRLQRENSMILSVMRTLETSLEDLPLFTPEEISEELKKIPGFDSGSIESFPPEIRNVETLFPILVSCLDGVVVRGEGMETELVISTEGNLEGIFQPDHKPWTRILIPMNQSASSQPTAPGRD